MALTIREVWGRFATGQPQLADFLCPIGGDIMKDPVTAEDGFNYERSAITVWHADYKTSPQTQAAMGGKLVQNKKLKAAIDKFGQHSATGCETRISWPSHGHHKHSCERWIVIGDGGVEAGSVDEGGHETEKASLSMALGKTFQELDQVRDLLSSVFDGWTPPKIVVLGDESAGKSTLLEMLAMMPIFPRKRRFCTRLAIHLRLRRSSEFVSKMSVYNVPAKGPPVQEGEAMRVPQENGWVWVQEKMLALVAELTGDAKIVKDKIIVVEVKRPDVPSIDLVDTPGLLSVEPRASEIQSVLKSQLEEDVRTGGNSMYLAVVPAAGDVRPATNMAMKFVQEQKLEGKTLGVFTKCDQVSNPDILAALMTGEPTEQGETGELLGAVDVGKGWVSTMLKPPPGKEFDVHNFERILRQQKEDAKWWKAEEFQSIANSGQAGMEALVANVERQYFERLNTTWKDGAMRKILETLEVKEFELSLLGVIAGSEKEGLARREIERRLGTESPTVKSIYADFMKEVLLGKLCVDVRRILGNLNGAMWEGHEISSKLEIVSKELEEAVIEATKLPYAFFMPKLESIIVAESTWDTEQNAIVAKSLAGSLKVMVFQAAMSLGAVRRQVKRDPIIQLKNYKTFTTGVIGNCESLFGKAKKDLQKLGSDLTRRFLDPDSLWLELQPELVTTQAASNKVKVVCKVDGFLNALVAVFLRTIPSPQDLQKTFEGVSVGMEEGAAKEQYELLNFKIKQIEACRDGICRALSISETELKEMQEKFGVAPAAA